MTNRVVGVVLVFANAVDVLPHEAGGRHAVIGILPLGIARGIPAALIGVVVLADEVDALNEGLVVLVLDGALEVVLLTGIGLGLRSRGLKLTGLTSQRGHRQREDDGGNEGHR